MKKDTLERAMMHLDDRLIRQAAHPAATKSGLRWTRVALIAACVAALMTVTVGAGACLMKYRITREDDRRLVLESQAPAPVIPQPETNLSQSGQTIRDRSRFETVYLPTRFPSEAKIVRTHKQASATMLNWYEWEWITADNEQIIFEQTWKNSLQNITYSASVEGITYEYGEIQLAGYAVTYVSHFYKGISHGHDLIWEDGDYQFSLSYNGKRELEELEGLLASLEPVEQAEYDELLELYLPQTDDLTRRPLEQVLLPGEVPAGLTFSGWLKRDSCTWKMQTPDDDYVLFYQEDLGCDVRNTTTALAKRRWEMKHNSYLVTTQLAGRPVHLLGDEESYVWEYFWEQDGNWCMLRVDEKVADLLDMDIPALAASIVEGLASLPYADVPKAMDALR